MIIVFGLIGFDLLYGRKENMIDTIFGQVLIPHGDFLGTNKIAFVD